MSLIIGLTGGIGCGKSTVADFFKMQKIEVVDADQVARLVVQKGQPALSKISDHFGEDILCNGELNRGKLRQIIFADETQKNWLNNLLHPIIREEMLKQLHQAQARCDKNGYVILEAPLLFENNLEQYCAHIIVVDIDETLQIQRATKRDNSSVKQIKAIIDSQISRKVRLQKANFIIDNSAVSLQQLENSVIALDKQLRALQ